MAEGAGEDESADQAFRIFAVNTYLKAAMHPYHRVWRFMHMHGYHQLAQLLEKSTLSDILVQAKTVLRLFLFMATCIQVRHAVLAGDSLGPG